MGFYDLCVEISENNEESLRRLFTRLYEMGYKTVAVNQTVEDKIFENESKKKKKSQNPSVNIVPHDLWNLREEFKGKLVVHSRLTFSYTDPAKTYSLVQLAGFKQFDLFAVLPKGQAAFQFALSQLSVDLVTINSSCGSLKFSRKLYMQAVERGVHFEIHYVDLISTKTRIFAIQTAHSFHVYGKSKNVIVASGAQDYTSIRYPYDIVNLGSILGLNEYDAKAAILSKCKHLLLKAEGRRYGKAVFSIQIDSVNNVENSDDENDESSDSKKVKTS